MTNCLIDFLNKQDVEYIQSYNLKRKSFIGIGAECDLAVFPKNLSELIKALDCAYENGIKYKVVGRMTNILPPDLKYSGVIIFTNKISNYYRTENTFIAESGALFSKVITELSKASLGGFEELYGIPGSVGGMVFGNAGAFGKSISDCFLSARVYSPKNKKEFVLTHEDMCFSYRQSALKNSDFVLLSASFKFLYIDSRESKEKLDRILALRKEKQPYDKRSLGSVFKRVGDTPVSLLIDRLGLKGYRIGDAQISDKHAGFIINCGNATSSDFKKLTEFIKEKIYSEYGLALEEEIEYL